MSRSIHYAMMTQNEAYELIPHIERVLPYVDSVTIVDGGSKDQTIYYFRNWEQVEPKLRFFIYPWSDNFPAQRNNYLKHVAEIAKPGDWIATADADEYYADETLEKLHKVIDLAEQKGCNLIGLQCRSVSMKGPERVWENLDEYWKHLIIKWDPNFHYSGFRVHEGKAGIPHNIMNTGLIYEHVKQENIIWLRGFRNLFCGGGGPNLGNKNPVWPKLRKLCREKLGIDSWHDMYDYILAGNIDEEVKQIFIDHRLEGTEKAGPNALKNEHWDGASEMREMYKSYFRLLHPEEEPEEFRGEHIP